MKREYNMDKIYWQTKSKVFAYAVQFITNKKFFKFNDNGKEIIYSFEINNSEKKDFFNKIKELEKIKYK